jgi:hypothetical protein
MTAAAGFETDSPRASSEVADALSAYQQKLLGLYETNGFILIKNMLDADAALRLRHYIAACFENESDRKPYDVVSDGPMGSIKPDIYNRFPEVYREIFFRSAFVIHLKLLLGDDFVLIPDTAIHKNSFGSWHKDVRAQQTAGCKFHWEEDYKIVTIGLYFQENTPEYGGGLEIIPGTHTIRFPQYPPNAKGHLIQSTPGDVVIFNHSLDHKASWPSRPVPLQHTKYSVFLAASKNNAHVGSYMEFLKTRQDYGWIPGYSYPDDLRRHAHAEGYGLAV